MWLGAQSGSVASCSDDGRICTLREVSGGESSDIEGDSALLNVRMLSPHGAAYVRGLAWNPTGNTLLSGGWDGAIVASPYSLDSVKCS